MIKKIDHLVITTAQIEHCLAFYKKLGFAVIDRDGRYELFAGDFKINVHIWGNEFTPHGENVQLGSADLCFELDGSAENYKQQMIDQGIEILLGVVERSGTKGLIHSFYLRDPDGNLVEFCSYES